jgi:hypothetical protein
MKNCLPADMLELPQQCPFRVAVHQDVLTGLTREIGIHKDHFPFAKEGLHGVVFDRHGKRAFSLTSVSSIASAWTTPGGSCFVNI